MKLLVPSLRQVISGGQVGADAAGVEVGRLLAEAGFRVATGGTMPRGWTTKAGPRPDYAERYGMVECASLGYPARTHANVAGSDATVAYAYDFSTRGELLTARCCREAGKPYLQVPVTRWPTVSAVDFYVGVLPQEVAYWLTANKVRTLNVAGNADASIEPAVRVHLLAALLGCRR